MTLTAVSADHQLHNPSALLDLGQARSGVSTYIRALQKDGLYCPHCLIKSGNLIPVRFRDARDKRPHFFHPQSEGREEQCKHYSTESEKHLNAKSAIAESLKLAGLVQVEIEVLLQYAPGLPWRKPDILVTEYLGAMTAHEVQISYINSSELSARTADLKKHGCTRVLWYLYGKNFNDENRHWIHRSGMECYRLWFEEGDSLSPRWKLTPYQPIKGHSPGKGMDTCSAKVKPVAAGPKDLTGLYRHINPAIAKHNWHARIIADYGDFVDVVWEEQPIPGATICKHPLYDRTWNRVHTPDRLPKAVLMPWVESVQKSA